MAPYTDTYPRNTDEYSAFPPANPILLPSKSEQLIIFIASMSLIFGHCNVLIGIIPRPSHHVSVGAGRKRGYVLPDALEEGRSTLRESLTAHFLLSLLTPFVRSSESGAYAYFSFLTEDTLVTPNLL